MNFLLYFLTCVFCRFINALNPSESESKAENTDFSNLPSTGQGREESKKQPASISSVRINEGSYSSYSATQQPASSSNSATSTANAAATWRSADPSYGELGHGEQRPQKRTPVIPGSMVTRNIMSLMVTESKLLKTKPYKHG